MTFWDPAFKRRKLNLAFEPCSVKKFYNQCEEAEKLNLNCIRYVELILFFVPPAVTI